MSMPPSSPAALSIQLAQRAAVGDVDGCAGGVHALVFKRGNGLFHLIGIARADADIGAFGGQRVGNGAADAAASRPV